MAAQTATATCTLQSFNLVAVATGADTVVTCGMEDVSIQHLNLQATDTASPAASVAGDYIVVMDNADKTTPTNDCDTGTAAGSKSHKIIIPAGGSAVFPAYAMAWGGSSRALVIRAVGHTALVQLVRGSVTGDTQ